MAKKNAKTSKEELQSLKEELTAVKAALKAAEEELRRLKVALDPAVEERTQLLRLVRDVAAAANEAGSVEQAFQFALEAVCESEQWDGGRVYQRDERGQFVPTIVWYCDPGRDPALEKSVNKQSPDASNKYVERVLRTGVPCWESDLDRASDGKRRRGKDAMVRSAIWMPVVASRSPVAVLEFFSHAPIAPDERFLEAMNNVGIQLGQVVERKDLEKQVAEATDREQRRIGQELHDGLGQQISGLAMMATMLAGQLEKENSPHSATMRKLLEAAEHAKVQARALNKGLLPVELEGQGLMAALQELAESVQKVHGVECVFQCGAPVVIGDSFTATHLYHIGREAVHNAVKHAQPRRITVSLSGGADVVLSVRDNGIGFSRPPEEMEGQGLRIMRYRAGLIGASLTVQSGSEGGAVIVCTLPQRVLS